MDRSTRKALLFILALYSVTPFTVDKATSKLNWTRPGLKGSRESRNPCLQSSICESVWTGGDWVAWGRMIHTHAYLHTRAHTHSFSPPPTLGPRRCLAPCRAARLLHWVPGWPVLFPCSNAPFVFVLLFWEWKKGAIQWGEWWIGGRENERATERERERYRERKGGRERGREIQGSLLLWAQWKPSRGSRLDNLSDAPRLFSKAARLLATVATAVTLNGINKLRNIGLRLTLISQPACDFQHHTLKPH